MLISQQKQYFKKLLLKFVIHCSREIGWNAEIQYYKKTVSTEIARKRHSDLDLD